MAEPAHVPPILVIGTGNLRRGDDAVGLVVARGLRTRLAHGATLIEFRGDGAALLELWRGARAVILVDAAATDGHVGAIARFDATAGLLPLSLHASSTHAFGAGEAIELARALGALPPTVLVYAITGQRFTFGAGLSPAVKAAARLVIEEVAHAVRDLGAP